MHKKPITQRLLALLMTVVMVVSLFPVSALAQGESITDLFSGNTTATGNNSLYTLSTGNGDISVKPFYLVNWDRNIETNKYSNVYHMPYTWTQSAWYNAETDQISIGVYVKGGSSSNIKTAAKLMYDDFSQRPAGTRYLNLAAMGSVFNMFVKDAIDFEDGIRLVADWLDRFLTEYKSLGGELDGIATDLEYNYYTSFYLQSHFCTKYTENGETKEPRNLDILQDIVRNERVYQAKIRPQLKELEAQGLFQFYTTGINAETGLPDDLSTAKGPTSGSRVPIPVSEITTINRYADNGGISSCASMWNAVLLRHLVDCINRAAYYPMLEHYPDAILSDYSHADTYSWEKGFSTGGETTGTSVKAGNSSNGVYYGSSMSDYFYSTGSGSTSRQLYYKPAGQDGAVYEPDTAYSVFEREINNNKRIVASAVVAGTPHTSVWVPYFHYASTTKSYGNTAYYSELIYHLGLTNPEPFLGYLIESEVKSKGNKYFADDPNMANFQYALGVTNELLAELTRVAGASDRKPIVTPIEWDDPFMISGIYAGSRNLWRITPDATKVSVEAFKVDGKKTPTFTVDGITVTFPQGRIIEDTSITQVGTCGYWIETPADVTPVITRSTDHISNNPAFGDTFEDYNLGAFTGSRYSIDTTNRTEGYRPDTYWTVDEAGSAAIVSSNGGKALTMTGTTTLTNSSSKTKDSNDKILTVPSQITAGDYYAQQQVWEVTVTMPSSFSGTIKLLSYSTGNDGFQISSSGAVRYPVAYSSNKYSYYTNMGLSLSAGKTYTFKRVIDFTAKTCSYYVYDANSNLLKSQTNKAILNVTTPVSTIYMTTSSVSGTVTIDNYKLNPYGLTTNLDLYEEITLSKFADYTGIVRKLSDTSATRTTKTAYRVSWLNNSGEYKYAVLKNSTTGAVIEKVLMAPGESGYFTGTVNASASAPVTFALTQESATAPTVPDYESGNFDWPTYAENMGICCYITDQGYAKLEDALAAAKDGQTIVMIGDAVMASTATVDSSVKIRQNGHAITLADGFTGDYAIALAAGGKLTWTDGLSINAGSKTAFGVIGGDLTVSGGTITGQNGILVAGGNLTVSGGTVTAADSAIVLSQDAEKTAATVTVTGGTLSGTNAFLHKNTNDTPSENLTASISGAAITGAVETTEEHFEIQTADGVQTLHGHTVVIHKAVAPTCTDTGLTQGVEYPCCNKFGTEQQVVEANGHNWVDATYCGATKYCSVCSITDGDPKEHAYGNAVVTPPTCTVDGYTTETCTLCGHVKTYSIVPAAHTPGNTVDENIVPANCTDAGTKDEVVYCTVCTEEISRTKVTTDAATGHTPGSVQIENEIAPTCTVDGSHDNVTYCTVCTAEISRQTITDTATGHTPGDVVVENKVEVTCTTDGSYDNATYCTICLAEASRQTVIVPAPEGGHNADGFMKDVTSVGNCTTPNIYDNVVYCTACGYEHSRNTVTIAAPGHDYVSDTSVDGYITKTCNNCDHTFTLGTKASLTILTGTTTNKGSWNPTLSMGMKPVYAKNDENGVVTAGTEDDWTIKVEWPTDGIPTMTLKNAKLINERLQSSERTIVVSGNTDWDILLEGENTIMGSHSVDSSSTSIGWKGGEGLRASNTGLLTIKGRSKADKLTIDNNIGTCINRCYGPMIIENATVRLEMRAMYYSYAAIYMAYGSSDPDVTDLTIRNADFTARGYRYNGLGIIMGSDPDSTSYDATNVGDILFQNSMIDMQRTGTSGWQTPPQTAYIRTGTGAKFEIDRCDLTLYGSAYLTRYVPTLTNCETTLTKEGGSEITDTFTTIKATHTCKMGDIAVEIIDKGACNIFQETVAYCIVCNERNVQDSVDISYKAHTPGRKVELTDQRVAATRSAAGKYVFETTCAICGKAEITEEKFGAALLRYLTSDKEGATAPVRNLNTWPASNTGTDYYPNVVMNPGDAPRYFITTNSHATYVNNYYVSELTNADEIAAGNWQMKLEYPLYGTPVLTLKGAKIINNAGLWLGCGAYTTIADYKIVILEDSEISNNVEYNSANTDTLNGCAIRSLGSGNITITGPGKLTVKSNLYGNAIIMAKGSITLDKAHIDITKNDTKLGSRTCSGIYSSAGNVTINGGKVQIFCYCPTMYEKNEDGSYKLNSKGEKIALSYRGLTYGIYAYKDVTIRNGADINVTASLSGNAASSKGIRAVGALTISESSVLISHGGYAYGDAMNYGTTFVLDYANGYNARTSGSRFSYNTETGEVTYPTGTAISGTPTADHLAAYMFKISPKENPATPGSTALIKFEGTAVTVEDDLTLEFAIPAENIPEGSIAYITKNGITTQITLTEALKEDSPYYVIPCAGIAAKEMHDTFTVVVKTADGKTISETITDSVYDYLVRMLRKEENAADKKLLTVLVNMLNYGTMAQVQFNHNTANLANTILNPTEWEYADETFVKPERTPAADTGNGYIGTTFELKTHIAMLMGIRNTELGTGSYAMVYVGDSEVGIRVDAEDAEGNDIAVFTFNELTAAQGRTDVTWKFYKAGEDAATAEPTLVVTDSLVGYVSRMIDDHPYLENLMKYCDAAAAYFDTKN